MTTLAPKISDQISFERPVGAAPSVLESVIGVATDLGADYLNAKARANAGSGLSASDQKGQELSGYVAELDRISSMDIPQSEKDRLIERVRREQLIATPQYRTDILGISSDEFGQEPGQGDFGRAEDDAFVEWLQTPKGLAAMSEVRIPGDSSGAVDNQSTAIRLRARFREDQAQQARIAELSDSKATDEIKWRELSPQWSRNSAAMATGLALNASTNPELLSKPSEVLDLLDSTIRTQSDQLRAEAIAAGISVEYAESQIAAAVKPLTDLRSMYQSQMETPGQLLDAIERSAELGVTRQMIETMGPHMADPVAREVFYNHFFSSQINGDNAEAFFNQMSQSAADGEWDGFNFSVPVMPGVEVAVTSDEPVVSPDKVSDWRAAQEKDPEYLGRKLATATSAISGADTTTDVGKQAALTALQHIATGSQAHEGPLGEATLRMLFSPRNMAKIRDLGPEAETIMSRILIQQVRYNRALVSGGSNLLNDQRVRQENGVFVAERRWRDPLGIAEATGVRSDWRPANPNGELAKTVNAVNYLMTVARQMPGVQKQVTDATNWLYRGVEPTVDQLSSTEEFDWGDIENVQHVSYQAPNALIPLIDRTEGGGEYDTLFAFSNRPGGRFADVRVDQMTISEVLQFADPSGPYGQWVKEELGRQGQRARVATPMGRYQFVGTTLREVAQEMGLPEDTIFNAKTQDAMFDHLARKVIRGKSRDGARQAMRNTWEGFKHVSDSELDAAIASFLGSPPPAVGSLDRAIGGPNFGPTGTQSPPGRGNGFMISGGGVPRGREFNPIIRDSDSSGVVPEQRAGEASRMNAAEARAQIVAALRAAGMEDMIKDILKDDDNA